MKTLFCFLLLLSCCFSMSAQQEKEELMAQLSRVNKNWKHQEIPASADLGAEPRSYNQWIECHLKFVEQALRARDTQHLTAEQQKRRMLLLDALRGYASQQQFPINDYLPYQQPVFIDRNGTHCAVGYLMKCSGHEDLAQEIDREEKFDYIQDIQTRGVAEWAIYHGFTLEELAWIQPSYPPQSTAYDLNGGVNGTVLATAMSSDEETLYLAGGFSGSHSGAVGSNILAWRNGFAGFDWVSLGIGTNDTIRSLLLHDNKLYIGGDFTESNGATAEHVAVYDIVDGTWSSMGALDGAVHSLVVFNNTIYAGGRFSGFLARWNGTSWEDIGQGFMYGEGVRTLEVWGDRLVLGGNFELATGAIRKHVAAFDNTYIVPMGMGTLTPVNDFALHNGSLYAACDMIADGDTCALAMYNDQSESYWEKLIAPQFEMQDGFWGSSIRSLASDGSKLLCGGDFSATTLMTYGNHLMAYERILVGDELVNTYEALLLPDAPVRTIALYGDRLFFGGEFQVNLFNDTLRHIGYLDYILSAGSNGIQYDDFIEAYPIPANNTLTYTLANQGEPVRVSVHTLTGSEVYTHLQSTSSGTIPVAQLANGVYLLQAQSSTRRVSMKIIVQH